MNELDQIQQEVEELEPRVERLKALYQQYFMGIEKIPPDVLRKEVDRTIWRLRREQFRNTRLRFKFQQIVQRYNTYQQYWARVQRDIDKGVYQRDVLRAARRFGTEVLTIAGRRAQRALRRFEHERDELATPSELAGSVVSDRWSSSSYPSSSYPSRSSSPSSSSYPPAKTTPAPKTGPPPPKTVPPPRPPPPRGALPGTQARRPPNDPAARTRELYDEYLRARRAAGVSGADITFEKLAQSLAMQTERLRQKHGAGAQIDYVVVTKDGKPMIRPVIK
jgi:hypothetical protein